MRSPYIPKRGCDKLVKELEEFPINDSTRKVKKVGLQLKRELKTQLVALFWNNINVFAWGHEDLLGIDFLVKVHKINVELITGK